MSHVLILRGRAYTGMLSAIVIEIDGKTGAKIRRGSRIDFDIPDGEHVITARMHWLRSPPLTVTAQDGTTLRFACGCRGYGGSMRVWLQSAGFDGATV